MGIKLNGTTIFRGAKPVINGTALEKIVFNGNTVWEYDTSGHNAPLSVCTRTSYSGTLSNNGYTAETHISRTYEGEGFSLSTSASWAGTIDLTQLPDWRYIKKVEITHPRYNGHEAIRSSVVTTHTVTAGQTSISFSDYSSQSNDTNGGGVWGKIGNECRVHAIAGVQQITYYYV